MSKDHEIEHSGGVPVSQQKVSAIRKTDGSYQLRYGINMKPLPVRRVVLDESAEVLYSPEEQPGPHLPSRIDTALARLNSGIFKAAIRREQKNLGVEVAAELPDEVVEQIRAKIYGSRRHGY